MESPKRLFLVGDIMKLLDPYKGLAAPEPNNGRTTSFCNNVWNRLVPKLQFLELLFFCRKKE